MIEKSITNLTLDELLNPHFIESIFLAYPDDADRQVVLDEVLLTAEAFEVSSEIKKEIKNKGIDGRQRCCIFIRGS